MLWCLLSAFRFLFGCHFHQWGLNNWGFICHCFKWGKLPIIYLAVPQPIQQYGRPSRFGAQQSHQIHLPSLHGGRDLLLQVVFHLMRQTTLNLWWMLNLVILVWRLGIRFINVLTPGQQSALLLNHTFILVSHIRWLC